MPMKDKEEHSRDEYQDADKDLFKNQRTKKILLSAAILAFGLGLTTYCYLMTTLVVTFGPITEKAGIIKLLLLVITPLLASIVLIILWLKNIKWSRYPIMLLAILGTGMLFASLAFDNFLWIVIALILDVYLFKCMFLDPNQK